MAKRRRTDNTMTKRRTDNTMAKRRRTDNTMAKRRTDNTMAKRRTDNTMAKRKKTTEQTTIYIALPHCEGERRCSGKVSSSCSTCDNFVQNSLLIISISM
jgi:hypothetical protein